MFKLPEARAAVAKWLDSHASKGLGIAQREARDLPSGVKCFGMCKQFAEGLEAGLKAKCVPGTRIEIHTSAFVYSDKFGRLGDKGMSHKAVQVGDTVFDNFRPGGVPAKEFFDDLGGDLLFDSPAHRVTTTVF